MLKLKTLALTLSGISAFCGATYAHSATTATPNQVGMAMMRLNSALLDQAKSEVFGSGSLWASLRKDFRISEVNPELVRRHENKFVASSAYFDRTINRSKPYLYHIANEVKKRNMPAEIALLPFIESAYVTKAKSPVGASGLWQFMPATGRHYGLEKTELYDGRHDIYAATNAALNYLEYLHGLFGDWSLALAAYNWGEGNVGRAVNRARALGLEPTYENLRMPNETRNYVPKLLAVRNIIFNPQSFGMSLSEVRNQPYFKAVDVDQAIDNSAIVRLANISENEFQALNPAFNAPVFIPKANRKLLLPYEAASTFEKNYRNAQPDTLLSWDLYTSYGNTSLNKIAAETGMSINEIKRLNGIKSNILSSGHSILVAKNSLNGGLNGSNLNFIDTDTSPDTYRSDMPAIEPIQLATAATTTEQAVKPIAATKAEPYRLTAQTADHAQINVQARPVINISPAATAVATIQPTVAPANQTIAAVTPTPETDPAQTIETTTTNNVVAITEPLVPPTQNSMIEETDSLMSLVENSTMRQQAADIVRETIAKATEEENEVKARPVQVAERHSKQPKNATPSRNTHVAANTQRTAAGTYRVTDGDTLFSIARRHNLSVADLITTNNIKGNHIKKGQVLRVTAAAPKASGSIRNVTYTVRRGDTLNTIANRFNVNINDIRRWNQNTRTVTPGQRLKLQGS